jgi:hypothetical protein
VIKTVPKRSQKTTLRISFCQRVSMICESSFHIISPLLGVCPIKQSHLRASSGKPGPRYT